MGLGAAGKIAEFNAFRDGLSPSARAAFGELSLLEQTRLADLATRKNVLPETISRYVDLTKWSDSLLHRITPRQGLDILSGKVVQIDPALAMDLAAEISKATGRDAWGSASTGEVYFPASSPRAWAAADQLIAEGINGPDAGRWMQVIGEESIRGSGSDFQMGPFVAKDSATGLPVKVTGVERGIYFKTH
jgi:hypothetical protein